MRLHLLAIAALGCGGNTAAHIDASTVDAATGADAPPAGPSCGCAASSTRCLSFNAYEWEDQRPLTTSDAITASLVDENHRDPPNPIATATPDADGNVVFADFTPPSGVRLLVVFDDTPGSGNDDWAPTTIGPVPSDGTHTCMPAPTLSRAHGDTYLQDVGYPRSGTTQLSGSVILELHDSTETPTANVGVSTMPLAVLDYISGDCMHVLANGNGTTSSGAVLTTNASYCLPFCTNITCSCGAPGCEPRSDFGGTASGFVFVQAECDP